MESTSNYISEILIVIHCQGGQHPPWTPHHGGAHEERPRHATNVLSWNNNEET
jgi:hypothetical protein